MILAFNKPYGIASQFTKEENDFGTLADFGFTNDVYPIGRLDATSEGLILLGNEKQIVDRLLNPKQGHQRTYLVQVEGNVTAEDCRSLEKGVVINDSITAPSNCEIVPNLQLPERSIPIRKRKSIPTTFLVLQLTEGKNRQVRKMTATIGKPTLRLIRISIGSFPLSNLSVGSFRQISAKEQNQLFLPLPMNNALEIAYSLQ